MEYFWVIESPFGNGAAALYFTGEKHLDGRDTFSFDIHSAKRYDTQADAEIDIRRFGFKECAAKVHGVG